MYARYLLLTFLFSPIMVKAECWIDNIPPYEPTPDEIQDLEETRKDCEENPGSCETITLKGPSKKTWEKIKKDLCDKEQEAKEKKIKEEKEKQKQADKKAKRQVKISEKCAKKAKDYKNEIAASEAIGACLKLEGYWD